MPQGWGGLASRATRQEVLPLVCRGISALSTERHKRNVTGTLDGCAKLSLVSCTIAGDPAWDNFPPLGDQVTQALDVLIIDVRNLIRTEATDLLAWESSFRRHPFVASLSLLAASGRGACRQPL
jgi:hypothetical protein